MSIKQMTRVWEHEFTHPQQSVMLALADHAHDDGTSIRPGLERVAWKTGYSLRQTKRIISSLREMGVLVMTRNHGDGRPAEYRIDWERVRQKQSYEEWREGKSDILSPPKDEAKVTSQASKSDISGIPKVTSRVSKSDIAMSPEPSEPSIEPSRTVKGENPEKDKKEKPKKTKGFDPLEVDLPESVDPETWELYVAHRKEIGQKLTPTSTKLRLKDLADYPADIAKEALLLSIKNGWQGVFPGKVQKQKADSSTFTGNHERPEINLSDVPEVGTIVRSERYSWTGPITHVWEDGRIELGGGAIVPYTQVEIIGCPN